MIIRNLMIQSYFDMFYILIVGGGKLRNIEDSSLVILGSL